MEISPWIVTIFDDKVAQCLRWAVETKCQLRRIYSWLQEVEQPTISEKFCGLRWMPRGLAAAECDIGMRDRSEDLDEFAMAQDRAAHGPGETTAGPTSFPK